MIKVLIVDDEKLVRIAMRNIISWEECGARVLGYVKDGVEALGVLEKEKIDLLITDLKMPNMDGITLIKEIKKRKLNTTIVVLSNHGDFVREAMKNGAFDYLLKLTIEAEAIEEILKQVKEMIFEKEECKVIALENFSINHKEIENKKINFGDFKLKADKYVISAFSVECKENTNDLKKIHLNIENIAHESLEGKVYYEIIWITEYEGVFLFSENSEVNYKRLLINISKNIKQYIDLKMKVIISNNILKKDIEIWIEKLTQVIKNDFYEEVLVVMFDEIPVYMHLNYIDISYHSDILNEVKQKNISKMLDVLDAAMMYMKANSIEPKDLKGFIKFIFTNIKGEIIGRGDGNFDEIDQFIRKLDEVRSFKEAIRVIDDYRGGIEVWFNSSNNKYRKEIDDVIKYINKNIENKITLGMVAKAVSMNESYLSRIFKNETGKNLMYFINEIKMDRAIKLLKDRNIMVKEVSAKVGIDDQFYFNKLFKKFYEISPSEFRKKTYR